MRDRRKNNQNGDGLLANFRFRRKWSRATSILSIFVAVGTISALMLPAITMNKVACGQEEHIHGAGCYQPGVTVALSCAQEVHSHTGGCYEEDRLICPLADFLVHSHGEGCYEAGSLVCPLPEVREHSHGEGCYQVTEIVTDAGHSHGDACYAWAPGETPTCGVEENDGHRHGEGCFAAGTELLCTLAEQEAHSHGDGCYTTQDVLTCTTPEGPGHSHGDGCFGEDGSLICETPEAPGHSHGPECHSQETALTCTTAETEGHAHGEGCYAAPGALLCTTPENDGHRHAEACFGLVMGELTCTDTEREPVVEAGEPELICQEPEIALHRHEDGCYTDGALTCVLMEVLSHQHGDGCFQETETQLLACEQEEHTHLDGCYEALELLCQCPPESEAHAEGCPQYLPWLSPEQAGDREAIQALLLRRLYREDSGKLVKDFAEDHQAMDFENGEAKPVFALTDGVIQAVSQGTPTEPSLIALFLEEQNKTILYYHTDPADSLAPGQEVEAGTHLGWEAARGVEIPGTRIVLAEGERYTEPVADPYSWWADVLIEAATNEPFCECTPIEGVHDVSCPVFLPLTTEELYNQVFQMTTLRGLFILVNGNVEALLSFNIEQVYALEDHAKNIEATSTMLQDEQDALVQLNDIILAMIELLGYDTCICRGVLEHSFNCPMHDAPPQTHKSYPWLTYNSGATENAGVKASKTLVEDENGNLAIQLEAWTEGNTAIVPTEIVFVVDQSGSMFQAADGPTSYMNYSQFIKLETLNTERGTQFPGYYAAITNRPNKNPDWNGNYEDYLTHVASLLKYENGKWKRSSHVYQEEQQYDNLTINPTYKEFQTIGYFDLNTSNFGNTKAKYFKTLYGSTLDAYYTLLEEVKDIQNVKIAVVGFSSPRGYGVGGTYGGTGIFKDGVFTHANDLTDQDYINAWHETDSQAGLNNLSASIGSIFTNYGSTCTQDGFLLTNEIFAHGDPNANRVVVLFTDGDPYGISTDTGWTEHPDNEAYNYAIQEANKTKNDYGANVYVFGPSNLGSKMGTFMQYLSSNYPQATSMDNSGSVAADTYYGMVGNSADLEQTFKDIGEKIYIDSNALDTQSELRDTVTQYFDIGGEYGGGGIKVVEIPYNGTDFDETQSVTLYDAENGIAEVTLTRQVNTEYSQTLSDGSTSKRYGEQIVVSGYDYSGNTVHPGTAKGSKLRLIIPIIRDPDFIGGNQVPTNATASGIYTSDGTPVIQFPSPKTDVTLTERTIWAPDLNLYLGGSYAQNLTVASLEGRATATVNGFALDLSKPDDDYGIDWQDDYSEITVVLTDQDGNEFPEGFQDLRQDQIYQMKLVVDPIFEGTEPAVNTSNSADIVLFYPELRFQDDTYALGEVLPDKSIMDKLDWLQEETRWYNTAGTESAAVEMISQVAPEIQLQYAIDHNGATMPNYDLPVDVTVEKIGYATDVQKFCTFTWKSCTPDCGQNIMRHNATTDSWEFYLHTWYTVELPMTGGAGTAPYMFSGWALILTACTLMYSTTRKKRKGAR